MIAFAFGKGQHFDEAGSSTDQCSAIIFRTVPRLNDRQPEALAIERQGLGVSRGEISKPELSVSHASYFGASYWVGYTPRAWRYALAAVGWCSIKPRYGNAPWLMRAMPV